MAVLREFLRRDVVRWWIFHSWWCLRFCLGQCQAVDWKIHSIISCTKRTWVCLLLNGWFSSNDTFCADNYIFFRFKLQACVAVRSGSCICTAILPSWWTVIVWKCCPGVCLRLALVVSASVLHPAWQRITPSLSCAAF